MIKIFENTIFEKFNEENIFNFNKVDAVAYLALYILIPCFVTSLSLLDYPNEIREIIYCYLSILISALNCIYDASNRWIAKKSLKNGKLFLIIIGSFTIAGYCILVIFSILLVEQGWIRCDYFLLIYFLVVIIAIIDIVCCFTKEIAWTKCIDDTGKEAYLK